MPGSQILDAGLTFNGRDFHASEVRAFGYSRFERAVSTSDKWTTHDGPVFVVVLRGEAYWDCGPDVIIRAVGGQAVLIPGDVLYRVAGGIYPRAVCSGSYPIGLANHQAQAC